MEIKDNNFSRQFETIVNGNLLKIEYVVQERKLFLTKIVASEAIDDDNTLTEFVNSILETIADKKLKVVPTSPKIVQIFRKIPGYQDLLPPGIRI